MKKPAVNAKALAAGVLYSKTLFNSFLLNTCTVTAGVIASTRERIEHHPMEFMSGVLRDIGLGTKTFSVEMGRRL